MQFEIAYTYTPELVKKATKQFIFMRLGWAAIVLLGIAAIVGVFMSFSPRFRWFGGFLVAAVTFYVFQWMTYFNRAVKLAVELNGRSMSITFADDNVAFKSEDHTSVVSWSRFSQLWILKDAWLFSVYSDSSYTTVPASCISEELSAFIIRKISENNGKITRSG